MIVDHSNKDLSILESVILKNDGTSLYGEIDMYRRIVQDCERSSILWHFWHDINLHISSGRAGEIQIDFLLISEMGVLIIEVKGGAIEIESGRYYYRNRGVFTQMECSPFEQAEKYQWALINHKIINGEEIFIDYVCAFPHATIQHTHQNQDLDLSYKMWNKIRHDSDASFVDFCLDVLNKDKSVRHWYGGPLSSKLVESVINNFAPTVKDPNRYNQSSLKNILEWLNVANMDTLESLQKNHRILIEGAPGTGKTTIAKAYIKKNKGLRGLYLCWTKLLAASVKNCLNLAGLYNCEVESYASFIYKESNGNISITELSLNAGIQQLESIIKNFLSGKVYDYVIIDEAQDVADKGMISVLNEITSLQHSGLQTGRFLILYDIEQGYNRGIRNLDNVIEEIIHTSAHFSISDNKRVHTNIEIVKYANELMSTKQEDFFSFWEKLSNDECACRVYIVEDTKTLAKGIKQKRKELCNSSLSNSTILVHSDLLYPINGEQDTVYDRLTYSDSIIELTTDNISKLPDRSIGLTSILKYKGLENHNIILVIPSSPMKSTYNNFLFEIYVGMTRAIMNIDIFLLNNIYNDGR